MGFRATGLRPHRHGGRRQVRGYGFSKCVDGGEVEGEDEVVSGKPSSEYTRGYGQCISDRHVVDRPANVPGLRGGGKGGGMAARFRIHSGIRPARR